MANMQEGLTLVSGLGFWGLRFKDVSVVVGEPLGSEVSGYRHVPYLKFASLRNQQLCSPILSIFRRGAWTGSLYLCEGYLAHLSVLAAAREQESRP